MIWWGLKTEAAFDVWSIEHLIMGISVGWLADKIISKKLIGKEEISEKIRLRINFILVMLIAYIWETTEHYIEVGLLGEGIKFWFQGVEHWSNRLIFDNIMVFLGWLIYIKKGGLAWFARVFSVVWLFVHIVMFPHSMYLHTMFDEEDGNAVERQKLLELENEKESL